MSMCTRAEALEVFRYWIQMMPRFETKTITEDTVIPHRGVTDELLLYLSSHPPASRKRIPFLFTIGDTIKEVLDQFGWADET